VSASDIAALSPPEPIIDHHVSSAFARGENVLDDWLRRWARANQSSGASPPASLPKTIVLLAITALPQVQLPSARR